MAIFRKIHTSFWSDSFVSDLDKDKKLFYIYLLTNERTKQCGVYEITKKQIAYDLGYSIDTVSKLIQYFIKTKKIKYNEETKELAIGNWLKYNNSTSIKVQTCINNEFLKVKDRVLIEYVKSIDTHPQEEEEQEEEKEQQQEKEIEKFKIKLREHVFISQSELDKLYSEYLEHEVSWMLDKLNDYKSSVGKTYKSDYGAINNWVKKAFEKEKNEFIKDNNTFSTRMQIVQNTINNTDWNNL